MRIAHFGTYRYPGIPFLAQGVSLDFDGSTEHLGHYADEVDLVIGNAWSIVLVFKADGHNAETLFSINHEAWPNSIRISHEADQDLRVQTYTEPGVAIKDYTWASWPLTWQQIVVTWDGTNLLLYKNATLTAASVEGTDDAGAMTATNRRVSIAANPSGNQDYAGNIMYIAIFGTALDQTDVTSLYNGGNVGQYNLGLIQSGPLHWWRLGLDSADIGKDSGNNPNLIDAMDSAVDITAADIVADIMGS